MEHEYVIYLFQIFIYIFIVINVYRYLLAHKVLVSIKKKRKHFELYNTALLVFPISVKIIYMASKLHNSPGTPRYAECIIFCDRGVYFRIGY